MTEATFKMNIEVRVKATANYISEDKGDRDTPGVAAHFDIIDIRLVDDNGEPFDISEKTELKILKLNKDQIEQVMEELEKAHEHDCDSADRERQDDAMEQAGQ
jgi:hypothetical protein